MGDTERQDEINLGLLGIDCSSAEAVLADVLVDAWYPTVAESGAADDLFGEKIGGCTFLDMEAGEHRRISYGDRFIVQVKHPQKPNVLLRVFWGSPKFTVLPFDLSRRNKLSQFLVTSQYPLDRCYQIKEWHVSKEVTTKRRKVYEVLLRRLEQRWGVPPGESACEDLWNLVDEFYIPPDERDGPAPPFSPSHDFKLFGAPIATQRPGKARSFDLLQIPSSNTSRWTSVMFCDGGIAHIHPETFEVYWDCY